jgi:RNA-directed DNA polymerase
LAKFGLELHAEKTRLIEFGQFAERNRKRRGEGKPETFTFLGFTHYCGKRRSDGAFIVWRKTAKKRMVAKLRALKQSCAAEARARQRKSVNGSRRCSGLLTNTMPCRATLISLCVFRHRLRGCGESLLNRRSQRGAGCLAAVEPDASTLDSFPSRSCILTQRNALPPLIQGRSRMRNAPVRICAGGDQ